MEWVLNEAKKMKKEAQGLNHKTGVISAQISIAQAYKFARNDKFNIRETDILSACFDAIDIAKKHPENKTEIYFTSQIEIQPIPFDRDWMLYCLSSAMIDIADSIIPNKLNFNIKYSNDGQSVVLTMVGSPLANPLFLGQIQTLKNLINHLTIKTSKVHTKYKSVNYALF